MTGLPGFVVILCLLQYSDGVPAFTGPGSVTANAATASLPETSVALATLFTVTATPTSTVTFAFAANGNPDSIATITSAGVVNLAASKTLDKETKASYTFLIVGTDSADTSTPTATLTVAFTVANRLEFAKTSYAVCVADGTVGGTVIGTYTAVDVDSAKDTVTYTNTPTTDLTVDATGALKVTTGRTLTSATAGGYTTTITADQTGSTTGASADGTTVVKVTVGGCSGAGQIQFMASLLLIPLLITRLF